MSEEIWKPIKGYEGLYSASSFGRVKAHTRKLNTRDARGVPFVRNFPEKIMKPLRMKNGYWVLGLTHADHSHKRTTLHRIIATAFHGPAPEGCHANHIDGDKDNNTPANLEWLTPKLNQRHARDVLGHFSGEKAPFAKLTWAIVAEIRAIAPEMPISQREIAEFYGVTQTAISSLLRGKTWKLSAQNAGRIL